MDQLTVGILAHVDAGKTTLSEALLYESGALRQMGRVDHQNAFLDTESLERERGITIFSKQALLTRSDRRITLLDTPGHADFSAEMERTLQVLDCAILVVSGADGPQGHTHTLWKLLERNHIPVFLFVNKMDQPGADRGALMKQIKAAFSESCLDFSAFGADAFWEEAALGSEEALSEYLDTGSLADETIQSLIQNRALFPCWFGSALKMTGVSEFLDGLARFAAHPVWGESFAARVYKISRDAQNTRLTHLKVTGGCLRVKDSIGEEKIDQIRLYSGAKFTIIPEAPAGTVCAVTGLLHARPGEALGAEKPWIAPLLEPALSYRMFLPEGCDPHLALPKLRDLTEEDPQLHIQWVERLQEIHVRLMGTVQAEILQRLILERFGWAVTFGPGHLVYRETIAEPVEGVGHFEPLRHYAEVHLLLEPGERNSGLVFASACSENMLDRNWQRLILTHLEEKVHVGVLTGSPITDMKITLISGRAHEKHTEGGDFRQATYRAVRQGLMQAKSILLEPWYTFRLEVPQANLGRALSDIQNMNGETDPPETTEEKSILSGSAPAAALQNYATQIAAYTKGRGHLICMPGGFRPCSNPEAVLAEQGYDPDQDLENPSGSVFCVRGTGHLVSWQEAPQHMHVPLLSWGGDPQEPEAHSPKRVASGRSLEDDPELRAIFERTYGAIKPRSLRPAPKVPPPESAKRKAASLPAGPDYLLVDGYNIIFAWEDLKAIARESLDAARKILMDILSNYQGFRKNRVILVFDAYKIHKGVGSVTRYHNIHVVYTKEAETADTYIEKASYQLTQGHQRVRVATSDAAEQLVILGHGAYRLSAQDLRAEIERTEIEIAQILQKVNRRDSNCPFQELLHPENFLDTP